MRCQQRVHPGDAPVGSRPREPEHLSRRRAPTSGAWTLDPRERWSRQLHLEGSASVRRAQHPHTRPEHLKRSPRPLGHASTRQALK
ncbi:hypothetical protein F0U62_05650 [Cystobacter fuscus]|nr:hypothetical protein F0U62_05650 [Cystobacter fuscus]